MTEYWIVLDFSSLTDNEILTVEILSAISSGIINYKDTNLQINSTENSEKIPEWCFHTISKTSRKWFQTFFIY